MRDARMSSTRSRQSLGGNHRLGEDPVAKLRLERGTRDELNAATDAVPGLALQPDELA